MIKLSQIFILSFSVFFLQTSVVSANLSGDAKGILKVLPQKKLTLDMVLQQGLNSDSFEIIGVQGLQKELLNFSRRAPLAVGFSGRIVEGSDKSSPHRPGSSYNAQSLIGALSVSKAFLSGTSLSLQSNYQNIDSRSTSFLGQGDGIHSQYHENKIVFNLRQDLWKNSFGYATRKSLESLEVQERNVTNEVSVNIENWAYELLHNYYNTWLFQSRVKVEEENDQRQRRLRKVTKLKLQRGTAERPDFLQAKSAEKNTYQNLKRAEQDLGNMWRHLVVTLKFPEKWLDIDPLLVSIELDEPIPQAESFCRQPLDLGSNLKIISLREKSKAARLNLAAAKNKLLPDVYFGLKLTSNGVKSADGGYPLKDSLENKNRGVFVELGVSIPMGNYENKANLVRATMSERSTRYSLSNIEGDLKINWKGQCLNLKRLIEKREKLKSIRMMQKQRVELEEKRFRVGQVAIFNVIQAGNDAALADFSLKRSEVEVRLSAWEILKMGGELTAHLKKLMGNRK